MKKIAVVLALALLFIGSMWFIYNPPAQKKTPEATDPETLAYNFLKSVKENDFDAFYHNFSDSLVAASSQGKKDSVFEFYKQLLRDEKLPDFENWKTHRTGFDFSNADSIGGIFLPLMVNVATVPEKVIVFKINSKIKLTLVDIQSVGDASQISDKDFPDKKSAFDYSFENLLSIGIFKTKGSDPNTISKEFLPEKGEFNSDLKKDFTDFFELLDKTKITKTWKMTVKSEENTLNLIAIKFTYNLYGRETTVCIIKNNFADEPLLVNSFYILNAAYFYRVSEHDEELLIKKMNYLAEKYLD